MTIVGSPTDLVLPRDNLQRLYSAHSDNKRLAPYYDKMLGDDETFSTEQLTYLGQMANAMYGKKWKKDWDALNIEYKPAENYNMIEESTDTRTPDLTTNETRTPDLRQVRTPNVTETWDPTGYQVTETQTYDQRQDKETTDYGSGANARKDTETQTYGTGADARTHTERTEAINYSETDELTFSGRQDTKAVTDIIPAHVETTRGYNNYTETETEKIPGKTEEKTQAVQTDVHNVYGFNSSEPVPESTDQHSDNYTMTTTAGANGEKTATKNGEETENAQVTPGSQTETTGKTGTETHTITRNGGESKTATEAGTETRTTEHTGTETRTTDHTGTETRTTAHNGSETTSTTGSEEIANTGTEITERTETGTDKTQRTLTRSGNIGVTTTQQMLTQELILNEWLFWEHLFQDLDKLFTIPIYF